MAVAVAGSCSSNWIPSQRSAGALGGVVAGSRDYKVPQRRENSNHPQQSPKKKKKKKKKKKESNPSFRSTYEKYADFYLLWNLIGPLSLFIYIKNIEPKLLLFAFRNYEKKIILSTK